MEYDDAPRLEITAIVSGGWEVLAPNIEWVTEAWSCVLLPDPRHPIWAKFVTVDAQTGSCRIVPDDLADLPLLRVGDRCPFFEADSGASAALVLDDRRVWQLAKYEASDAFISPAPPGGTWSTPARGEMPAGAVVDPGGWDHDHCEICWEKIGAGGLADGYVTDEDLWICPRCHDSYVVRRSLAFVTPPKPRP